MSWYRSDDRTRERLDQEQDQVDLWVLFFLIIFLFFVAMSFIGKSMYDPKDEGLRRNTTQSEKTARP